MVYETTLSQFSQFSDSLSIRPATSANADKVADENANHAKNPEQGGDTVSISPEARALIAPEQGGEQHGPKGDREGRPGQGMTLQWPAAFNMTPEDEKQANSLFEELDSIFGSGNELTDEQAQRVEEIFGELDSLLPVEEEFMLSPEDEKRVGDLFAQLDAIYANGELSAEQEEQALTIENEIDSIFAAAEEGQEGMTIHSENMKPKPKTEEDEAESTQDQTIDRLKEQIEDLQEEIAELEKSDLPEKEKNNQIQQKQAQLMELNDQLLKAEQEELKASGQASGGGTRANGFGNSVSNF